MNESLQTADPPGSADLWAAERRASVLGCGRQARLLAGILDDHGWRSVLHDEPDSLAGEDLEGCLLVGAERTLVQAARELVALARRGAVPAASIVVCNSIRPGEVRVALSSGVTGVVLADSIGALVPSAFAAAAGLVTVPRDQARQVEGAALSPRERQILGLLVIGYSNYEIAEHFVVAESTVKSHLSSAFGKLGVRSRGEAVDLILDAERGHGKAILGIGAEPIAADLGAAARPDRR